MRLIGCYINIGFILNIPMDTFLTLFLLIISRLVAYEEAIMGLFLLVCGVAVGMRGFATHVWQHAISSMLEAFFWGGINAGRFFSLVRSVFVEAFC